MPRNLDHREGGRWRHVVLVLAGIFGRPGAEIEWGTEALGGTWAPHRRYVDIRHRAGHSAR